MMGDVIIAIITNHVQGIQTLLVTRIPFKPAAWSGS